MGKPLELYKAPPPPERYRLECALGSPALVPPGESRRAVALAFLDQGTRIVVAGEDGGLRAGPADPYGAIEDLAVPGARVLGLSADRSGRILGVAPSGGRPRVLVEGRVVELDPERPRHRPSWRIALDPEGARAATANDLEGTVRLWRLPGGEPEAEVELDLGGVTALALGRSSAAAASMAGEVRVFDVPSGRGIDRFGLGGAPRELAFDPQGKWLAGLSTRGALRIREVLSGREAAAIPESWTLRAMAWTTTSELPALAIGASDGEIRLCFPDSGKVRGLEGISVPPILSMAACEGPPRVAVAGKGWVRVWDAATAAEIGSRAHPASPAGCLAFDAQGNRLAVAGWGGEILVWDIGIQNPLLLPENLPRPVAGVAASRSGFVVAGRNSFSSLRIRENDARPSEVGAVVVGMAVHPLDDRIAVACEDRTVRVFDAEGRSIEPLFGPHTLPIVALAFDPARESLFLADSGGGLLRWDMQSPEAKVAKTRLARPARALAFAPEGAWLAVGDSAGEIRMLDPVSLTSLRSLPSEGGGLEALAVSPDGRRIAWIDGQGVLFVVEPVSGRVLSRVAPGDVRFVGVAFSPDGARIAAGTDDGTIRIYVEVPPAGN